MFVSIRDSWTVADFFEVEPEETKALTDEDMIELLALIPKPTLTGEFCMECGGELPNDKPLYVCGEMGVICSAECLRGLDERLDDLRHELRLEN